MKRLTALIASLFMAGSTANAQSADDLCATAPADLLSALDGTWTLTHGPGTTFTGVGTMPFPAPKPTTLEFVYWSNFGFGVLSGDGQSMAMLPADAQATAEHIDDLLSNSGLPNMQPTDAECDWYALPSLVGTNQYVLVDREDRPFGFEVGHEEVGGLMLCSDSNLAESLENLGVIDIPDIRPPGMGYQFSLCLDNWLRDGAAGDMAMTVFLKFDSPNSASGVASFRGNIRAEGRRIRFAAETPIWMTR